MDYEEWGEVELDPRYSVSSFDRVMRVAGGQGARSNHMLSPVVHQGYREVTIHRRQKRVGVLVAHAFIGERPYRADVHHRDHDKLNDYADNLIYLTHFRHSQDHIEELPQTKLVWKDIRDIRRHAKIGLARKVLAELYDVSLGNIDLIVTEQRWKERTW